MNEAIYRKVKDTDFSGFFDSPEETEEINQSAVEMMNTVFNDPLYKSDPVMYVKRWVLERGDEEDYRIPEDQLLEIFTSAISGAGQVVSK